jgi:hypothetical protein
MQARGSSQEPSGFLYLIEKYGDADALALRSSDLAKALLRETQQRS